MKMRGSSCGISRSREETEELLWNVGKVGN